VPIPRYDEFYKDILLALADGAILSINELRDAVAISKGITDDDRAEMLDSGSTTKFISRVGWARTYLKTAGLVAIPQQGTTQITEVGKTVLVTNPPIINDKFLMQFETFRDFMGRSATKKKTGASQALITFVESSTPEERMEIAHKDILSAIGEELLQEIMNQSAQFFEQLVVILLEKMGYGKGHVTKFSGDEGIDGMLREDELGFNNIYIQAKRWGPDRAVGRQELQGFKGAVGDNPRAVGLFITTSRFTNEALEYAKRSHLKTINGKQLVELMMKYDVGVLPSHTYTLKKIDRDFFTT